MTQGGINCIEPEVFSEVKEIKEVTTLTLHNSTAGTHLTAGTELNLTRTLIIEFRAFTMRT